LEFLSTYKPIAKNLNRNLLLKNVNLIEAIITIYIITITYYYKYIPILEKKF